MANVTRNVGEPMSKEFALAVIRDVKRFYRRMYYQAEAAKPFNGKADYDAAQSTLDGLEKLIEETVQ